MADPTMVLAAAGGMTAALGLFWCLLGLRHRPVRLDDAMRALHGGHDPSSLERTTRRSPTADLRTSDGDLLSRWGAVAFTRFRLPLGEGTRRVLALQGRSIGDFFAERIVLAVLGLVTPSVVAGLVQGTGGVIAPLPLLASLLAAAAGWWWPLLSLRRSDRTVRADAGEALYTFFDLVTLERLANASAAQSLMAAATMSDSPLFARIRTALDRARLEQRPPWQELRRLAAELELPEIADIADVMRLDEQGAALTETLRARVQELRDAHLMSEKVAAQQVSERMTLWMVIPSMIFGLVFLTPPLLKLAGFDG